MILNQTFEPLQVCSARRAVVLLFAGKAERVEDTAQVMRSPSTTVPIPSVIRLQHFVRQPIAPTLSFNKKNILKRDAYTCQYCGRNGGERMTIDHVDPQVPRRTHGVGERGERMPCLQPPEGKQVSRRGRSAAAAQTDPTPLGVVPGHPRLRLASLRALAEVPAGRDGRGLRPWGTADRRVCHGNAAHDASVFDAGAGRGRAGHRDAATPSCGQPRLRRAGCPARGRCPETACT
ncbi:MAG: HNH endonuclease [Desulfobacterales bacterium]|nr:HNH endonuclease [Desulfobacterales bacterium]